MGEHKDRWWLAKQGGIRKKKDERKGRKKGKTGGELHGFFPRSQTPGERAKNFGKKKGEV